MFSRRPGHRFNRGRVATAAAAASPPAEETWLTILGVVGGATGSDGQPGQLLQWCRGDDVTLVGADVSSWTDKTGLGRHFTQTVGRPLWVASDAGANGQPGVQFDSAASECLDAAGFTLPNAGTTATTIVMVARQDAYNSSALCCGINAANNIHGIFQVTSTPELSMLNGSTANVNTNATIGVTRYIEAKYGNTTGDYLKVGSVTSTGAAAGNNGTGATGQRMGANRNKATFCPCTIFERATIQGILSGPRAAALLANAIARYGAGVGA